MKKFYLSVAAAAISLSAFAQSAGPVYRAKKADLKPSGEMVSFIEQLNGNKTAPITALPASVQAVPALNFGAPIGFTFRDVQSVGGPYERVVVAADGGVNVTWAYARRGGFNGSMAGFNHKAPGAAGLWDFGGTSGNVESDSLNYQTAGRTVSFTGRRFSITKPGATAAVVLRNLTLKGGYNIYPSIFNFGGNSSDLAIIGSSYSNLDSLRGNMIDSTFYDPQHLSITSIARTADTARWTKVKVDTLTASHFHVTRGPDSTLFAVGIASDTFNYRNLKQNGNTYVPVFYKSTNRGKNWSYRIIPQLSAFNGYGDIVYFTGNLNIVAQGNNVAIVANISKRAPNTGFATVLVKSYNGGNDFETVRTIDEAAITDTNRVFDAGQGLSAVLMNDGCIALNMDSDAKVHVTTSRGYLLTNAAGTVSGFYYPNGGFANRAASRIAYWNENFAPGETFRFIANYVDINGDGAITFPTTGSANVPGDYVQSGISQSVISRDQTNRMYVTYSALVETSETITAKVTRDIYVIASDDNGATWTNPINVAGAIGGQADGVVGGLGESEENYPNAVRQIGADGNLHMTWQSSDVAGSGQTLGSYNAATALWRPTTLAYAAISTTDIWNQFINAKFPSQVCSNSPTQISYTLPSTLTSFPGFTSSNIFYVEVDTSACGSFKATCGGVPNTIFQVATNNVGNTNGTLTITLPSTIMPGTYNIRVRASQGPAFQYKAPPVRTFGTSSVQAITVTPSAPTPAGPLSTNPGGASFCPGQSIYFSSTGSPLAAEYVWTINPSNAASLVAQSANAQVTFNASYTGAVTVSLVAKNGCGLSLPVAKVVNVGPALTVAVTTGPTTATLTATGTCTGPYIWIYNSDTLTSTTSTVTVPKDKYGFYKAICTSNSSDCNFGTANYIPTAIAGVLPTEVKVYPNPAKGNFNIALENAGNNAKISVYSAVGQLVDMPKVTLNGESGIASVNTSGLAAGVYTVVVVTDKAAITKRVVVQ